MGSARVRTTARVAGWQSTSTRNTFEEERLALRHRVMASAAAVASSSMEALARSMAVRSLTMVWKLSRASSRPWAISG